MITLDQDFFLSLDGYIDLKWSPGSNRWLKAWNVDTEHAWNVRIVVIPRDVSIKTKKLKKNQSERKFGFLHTENLTTILNDFLSSDFFSLTQYRSWYAQMY